MIGAKAIVFRRFFDLVRLDVERPKVMPFYLGGKA